MAYLPLLPFRPAARNMVWSLIAIGLNPFLLQSASIQA